MYFSVCLFVYLLVSLILNLSTNAFILLASIFLSLSLFFQLVMLSSAMRA